MNTTVTRTLAVGAASWGLTLTLSAFGAADPAPQPKVQSKAIESTPIEQVGSLHRAASTEGNVESSAHPEVQRRHPIERDIPPKPIERTSQPASTSSSAGPQAAAQTEALGPNLIANPSVETAGSPGLPAQWNKGGYGTNARTLTYPVAGFNSAKGLQVTISSYTSGDAKWYFNPVSVTRGTFTFSTAYKANVTTFMVAQLQRSNGSLTYSDTTSVQASSVFATRTRDVWIPMGVNAMTMFHVLKAIGELTTDDVALRLKSPPTGVFTTDAVSLTFDDGWLSQYQNAVPKLNAAGLKATFYIVTRQMADQGFPGYMSKAQVTTLFSQGHEIGAHTRTHRALTTLSSSEQQNEIQGSRQDLLAMNVGPVPTFAYPYGDYNGTTLQHVQNADFTSARSTLTGVVVPTWDEYQLPRFSMEVNTTFAQAKQAIATTIANKEWLVLVFHKIDNGSDRYTTSPATFNQVVDYLVQQGIQVIPVSQGIPSMQ